MFSAAANLSFGFPVGDVQSVGVHTPRLVATLVRDLFAEDLTLPAAPAAAASEAPSYRDLYAHIVWSPDRVPV